MDLNGMDFQNKILIASGCSFTGGGNFNNEKDFIREFPELKKLILTGVYGRGVLNNTKEFKKLYKNYLWPSRLGKLIGTKDSINVAAPGKGTTTSINNLYDSIFHQLKNGELAKNLFVIYQIPHFSREEVYISAENTFKCITTEVNDDESYKEMYLVNYYSLTLLYKTQIREIYKFQKFCDSMGISFICFSWESGDLKFFDIYDEFKEQHKYQKENKMSIGEQYLYKYLSVDDVISYDIDDMISEINFVNFDGVGLQTYTEIQNIPNFSFAKKYPKLSSDTHPTIDGCKAIAEILYKKLFPNKQIHLSIM